MANTQAINNGFRNDILTTGYNLNTKSFKAALYFTASTVNATTTAYTTTGEATGTNYTAGGVAVTNGNTVGGANTTAAGDTYFWTPSAAITFTNVTIAAFDTVMIYDSTTPFHIVGTWNFGNQTVTGANVTINMPTNNATTGLVRLL
jgi:hypothetical protein